MIFLSINAFSQSNSTAYDSLPSPILSKKSELKIDVFHFVTYGRLGISYERFLNKDFSGVLLVFF